MLAAKTVFQRASAQQKGLKVTRPAKFRRTRIRKGITFEGGGSTSTANEELRRCIAWDLRNGVKA
jgi:hypothetical protein